MIGDALILTEHNNYTKQHVCVILYLTHSMNSEKKCVAIHTIFSIYHNYSTWMSTDKRQLFDEVLYNCTLLL